MAKINLGLLIPLVVILVIAALSFFFFVPRNSYRNDCGKPLADFDVLFLYSPACPHCKAEFTIIQEVNLTEKFYMVDSGSSACGQIINQYYDYLYLHKNSNVPTSQTGLATPTKVCLYNNKTYVGEMQETELMGFYQNCTASKI